MIAEGGFLAAGVLAHCVESWMYITDFGEEILIQDGGGCASLDLFPPFPFHDPEANSMAFATLSLPSVSNESETDLPDLSHWCPFKVFPDENDDDNETEIHVLYEYDARDADLNRHWGFCVSKGSIINQGEDIILDAFDDEQEEEIDEDDDDEDEEKIGKHLPKVSKEIAIILIAIGLAMVMMFSVLRRSFWGLDLDEDEKSSRISKEDIQRRMAFVKTRQVRFSLGASQDMAFPGDRDLDQDLDDLNSFESIDLMEQQNEMQFSEFSSMSEDSS